MQHNHTPQLSVIVPVLDEAAALPPLFTTLASQQGIRFELILCDGGSRDGTRQCASKLASSSPFKVTTLQAPRGRGCQMNAGAAAASADTLLFLHVDSAFDARDALARAVSTLETQRAAAGSDAVAGRFALRFRRPESRPSLAYFYWEAKARLERSDCIRGDQGFMLPRTFFRLLGGFEERLPFLEDLRFADAVTAQGAWTLFAAGITTSARRFETEGLYERQVVNAIIVNSFVTGWDEFFSALGGLYRSCHGNGRLALFPILDGIRDLLVRSPAAWRHTFWCATGRHVAANAWQLFFWLDVRRAFSGGKDVDGVGRHFLDLYERRLERLFHTAAAATTAALIVRIWFRALLVKLRPPKR